MRHMDWRHTYLRHTGCTDYFWPHTDYRDCTGYKGFSWQHTGYRDCTGSWLRRDYTGCTDFSLPHTDCRDYRDYTMPFYATNWPGRVKSPED